MNHPTVFFIVIDGLGDRPIASFQRKTPLEAARTPNLDYLAQKGINGAMHTVNYGIRPGSDTAHLSLFGYDPHVYYTGRGPFEAFGIGMNVRPNDICFRVNMGTVDSKLKVIDRRAGRIDNTQEYADIFNTYKIEDTEFLLKSGTGYRLALIMRGPGLSSKISDQDPHELGKNVLKVNALDSSKEATKTARLINQFSKDSYSVLKNLASNKKRISQGLFPANYFLIRGAGVMPTLPSFYQRYNLRSACIAGAGLYKGIGRMLDMDIIDVPEATGKPDTNVEAKINKAVKIKNKYDFIYIHIKGADTLGENGQPEQKKQFIEKIDKALKPLINNDHDIIVVTADHSTPCSLKAHSADDVPITIVGTQVRDDQVAHYNERECASGRLGHITGLQLMPIIVDLLGLSKLFGD